MEIISLINMKGGVGKTTLSTNLADCLSRREGKRVLLVDIDPQFNATQCVFKGKDYMSYLENGGDTIATVFDDTIRGMASSVGGITSDKKKPLVDIEPVKIKDNFYLLPGSLDLHRIEILPASGKEKRLAKYIKAINEKFNFDYVLIDTPPTPSIWMFSSLVASDYYLIPVKPDPISFTGIDLLKSIVESKREDLDLTIKCIGLVFTMVERPDSVVYHQALAYISRTKVWKKYTFSRYLSKRSELAKSQLNQNFILDLQDGTIKRDLVQIVKELMTRINNEKANG